MPADGLKVNVEQLSAHGNSLEQIASHVTSAKNAGDSVRLGPNAYGEFCTLVPMIIGALQGVVTEGLSDAVQSLHDARDQIRATGKMYEEAEEEQRQRFERIHRRVRGHK
jgi:hypothetical protein